MSTRSLQLTRKGKVLLLVAVMAFIMIVSRCGSGESAPGATSTPAPTVTVTAPAKVTEKRVEVTPAVCAKALAEAEDAITAEAELIDLAAEGFAKISRLEMAGTKELANQMREKRAEALDQIAEFRAQKTLCLKTQGE